MKTQWYPSGADVAARTERIETRFVSRYGSAPSRWFSSPGRAEVVGNHTDHNLGKVLVSAVSCDILCAVSPREDGVAEIFSDGFGAVRVHIGDLAARRRETGKSVSFLRGVLAYLQEAGHSFGGFSAVTESNIFRGAGVSSSAAFSVLVAEIVNALYLGGKLTAEDKARAAQYAENVYFGKPCGLLDQMGVARGGLSKIDFEGGQVRCEDVPAPADYTLVLTNTGGSHAGLTAHYAAIKEEMGAIARHFGKQYLREVSYEDVMENIGPLRSEAGERAVLRAIHFFEENIRVDRAADALRAGDAPTFLRQVQESGESSLRWLQNCCVPAKPSQPLVLALKLSEGLMKDGAFRMMGGGFTGAVLAFCKRGTEREYGEGMARVFGTENVFYTDMRPVGTAELHF